MKNCLSVILLCTSFCCSIHLFAQEGVKTPKKNFLAIDIAPLVGVELDNQEYPSIMAYTFKRQINEKFRLRALGVYGINETNYGRVLHVFPDTILSFDNLRTNKKSWRAGCGIERTKRYGICEIYYGLQMHFGMDKRNFTMALNGTFGPDFLEEVPTLIYSNIWPHFSNYPDNEFPIVTRSQSTFKRVGLGIPIGFGVDIFRHLGFQVEITPGVQLTRSLEEFEYLNQSGKLDVENTTINLEFIGFNAFLGWKF